MRELLENVMVKLHEGHEFTHAELEAVTQAIGDELGRLS
jgi:hypothetical protein